MLRRHVEAGRAPEPLYEVCVEQAEAEAPQTCESSVGEGHDG